MARGGGGRSDDEDEERGGAGGKQLARSSRDEQAKDEVGGGAGSRAHDAERRTARWLSFAKPKLILGFEHLSPAYVPSMGSRKNGVSVCFDKITCWRPPRQLLADLDAGGFEVSVQLSLSLFHLSSGTFFGSTWMGESHLLGGDGRDKLPELIDFDYPEVVYIVSRITDPSCVAVVEIVASKEDVRKDMVVAQYGCGWTMLNIFGNVHLPDISEGHENVNVTVRFLLSLAASLPHLVAK